jgi:hypothetical protein
MSETFAYHGRRIQLPLNVAATGTPLTLDCTHDDDFLITDDGISAPVARNFTIDFSNISIAIDTTRTSYGNGFRVRVTVDGTNRTMTFGSGIVASGGSIVVNANKSIILYFEAFNGKMCLMSQSPQF